MPITSVTKDPDDLTLTVVADFDVPVRRLWDAYLDPRMIERFWGPPSHPATFTRHDGFPGGRSIFTMNGPDGEVSRGCWEWTAVEPERSFEVIDSFALADGTPNPDMPSMRMSFRFEATDHGSRLVTTTVFNSLDELENLLDMGMEDGMRAAMAQIDDVIADLRRFAAGEGTTTQRLDDTRIRVGRIVRGTVDAVWRAHHDPELLERWLLGPDGWTMPVCDAATDVGDRYRYEWEQEDGENRFGFTGEILESDPPHREVTIERMIGTDGPDSRNELTLTPVEGGVLVSLLITYPDAESLNAVLESGMPDGLETSYRRLEELVG